MKLPMKFYTFWAIKLLPKYRSDFIYWYNKKY